MRGAIRRSPYLAGVICTSCSDSPNYRWERTLAFEAIGSRLRVSRRLATSTICASRERDGSGRVRTFEVVSDRGSTVVPGTAFRRAVGSRVLPSLLLTHRAANGRRHSRSHRRRRPWARRRPLPVGGARDGAARDARPPRSLPSTSRVRTCGISTQDDAFLRGVRLPLPDSLIAQESRGGTR